MLVKTRYMKCSHSVFHKSCACVHMQWVIALDYEEETEKVTAATEDEVIVIDKNVSG